MMNELLQRIPATNQSTVQSEGSGRTIFDNGEEDDHSTSNTVAEPAFVNPWPMDRLACALENSDRSIQVHVPDFEGKLNANEYFDWTTSLEAFFDWKDLSDERKVQFVTTKLKGHALIWWQQYQCSRVRKRVPKFYQFLSRFNLHENDEQLVMSLKGEKDMVEKVVAQTFDCPNPQKGENKYQRHGIPKSECFRCGEAGHRSYECPKQKAENLVNVEEQEPTYDEVLEKVQCEPNFNTKCLLIQQVLVAPKDGAERIFDEEECCKTAATVDWSKCPIYDEYPEDEGIALGELTSMLMVHNTQRSLA
ncbi:hypothetical protein RHMOL_Rhmol03G0179900 [Rhododendron molle]|uniref:Uncharacterized protein n=1 Tax=Rhododendron molle TaxID=49168 RepID=A0ACC0PI54_RHOML|nr:hypothetical protein RHMOL_Rhmol03G0179900 [Rhododendron molle]